MANGTSTASRVVPAISETITRGALRSRLMYDDLPTFGRPTMATRSGFAADSSASAGGSRETTAWTRSSTPRECSAETGSTSSPKRANSSARQSSSAVSHLFAATMQGTPESRTRSTTSWSSGVMPSRASTTTTHTAESSTASAAWPRVSTSSGSPVTPRSKAMPPVSTSITRREPSSTSRVTRSRVTPGWSNTIATRFLARRLKSALLPVLGRPTSDTTFMTKMPYFILPT